jgi:hypothetical protein
MKMKAALISTKVENVNVSAYSSNSLYVHRGVMSVSGIVYVIILMQLKVFCGYRQPILHFRPQNMIAQSQSGTGKTAAFVLAMLSRVDPKKDYPQVSCRV